MCLVELNVCTVIPRNYVVIGSETCNVSRDDVNRDKFSRKHNVEIGREVPDNIFWLWKKYVPLYVVSKKSLQKIYNVTNKWQLKRHFLSCRRDIQIDVSMSINSLQLEMHESMKTTRRNQVPNLARQRPLLLLQNHFSANILVIPCPVVAAYCSFESMFCNTLMPPLVSPSTLANFETVIVLSLS